MKNKVKTAVGILAGVICILALARAAVIAVKKAKQKTNEESDFETDETNETEE